MMKKYVRKTVAELKRANMIMLILKEYFGMLEDSVTSFVVDN